MPMDIRSYFTSPPAKAKKQSRKRVFIDSDDSDSEPAVKTPKKEKTHSGKKKKISPKEIKPKEEISKEKVKTFFGSEPVKQIKINKVKINKEKPAETDLNLDFFDEPWDDIPDLPKEVAKNKESPKKANRTKRERSHSKSPKKTNRTKRERSHSKSPKKHVNQSEVDKKRDKSHSKNSKTSNESTKSNKPKTPSKSPQKSSSKSELLSKPECSTSKKHNFETKPRTKSPVKEESKCNKSETTKDETFPEVNTVPKDVISGPKIELWVDKWKPKTIKQIIGQQGEKSAVNKLLFWLRNWHKNRFSGKKIARPNMWAKDDNGAYFRAALLSGPPGIGKTTAAHLVAKELKMDIVEFNASDTRSKRLLHEEISELLSCKSLSHYAQGNISQGVSSHHVLIMDEVDGMAGNEDRGGIQELISLIKNTRVPIICMCNDRHHPKIRSLVNYCFDLKITRPRKEQIRGAMSTICFREGLKIQTDALNDVIENTNQDIRLILNSLSIVAAKKDASMVMTAKDVKLGAWDVVRKVFSEEDQKKMTIHDKCDLFFYDYNIAPLFVHENYLNAVPHSKEGKSKIGKMKLFAKAAQSLAYGDLMENAIRKNNAWSLLPTQAIFSSLIPGSVLKGHVGGKIEFPAWLGKNSKRSKIDRLSQEIQSHTRLKISGSKEAIVLDYARCLKDAIVSPLINGTDGIENSLSVMREYTLLREDLESLNELCLWPGQKDPFAAIETKVKSAFTRAYNKSSILTPFSVSIKKTKSSNIDEIEDDIDPGENEDEDEDDIEADSMILKNKKKPQNSKLNDAAKPSTSKGKPSTPKGVSKGRGKKK